MTRSRITPTSSARLLRVSPTLHACIGCTWHAHMHACTQSGTHVRMHARMHARIRACMHTCIHARMHARTYQGITKSRMRSHRPARARASAFWHGACSMRACMRACMRAFVRSCVHACLRANPRIHGRHPILESQYYALHMTQKGVHRGMLYAQVVPAHPPARLCARPPACMCANTRAHMCTRTRLHANTITSAVAPLTHTRRVAMPHCATLCNVPLRKATQHSTTQRHRHTWAGERVIRGQGKFLCHTLRAARYRPVPQHRAGTSTHASMHTRTYGRMSARLQACPYMRTLVCALARVCLYMCVCVCMNVHVHVCVNA